MHKVKTAIVLLLTAVLFAVCAMLPGMVSVYQDERVIGQPRYGETPAVALQIQEAVIPSPLEGLAMMGQMNGSITISDSMASMTCEAAEKAALDAMQCYIDAGLMEHFEIYSVEVRCMVGQVLRNSELSGIYWSVTILSDPDSPFCMAHLAIDDRTGRPILVNCSRGNPFDFYQRRKLLPVFAEIYFTGLNMEEYEHFAVDDLENQYIGENAYAVRYRFGDVVCGEVNVDLYVHEHGFYTEFPDLMEVTG